MGSRADSKHFTFGLPLSQNKRFYFSFLLNVKTFFWRCLLKEQDFQLNSKRPIGYTPCCSQFLFSTIQFLIRSRFFSPLFTLSTCSLKSFVLSIFPEKTLIEKLLL